MPETRYCWRCFAKQPVDASPADRCPRCGQLPDAPAGTTYTDKLLWSLSHPLVERRVIAATALGSRGERRALDPLRSMAFDDDPYLAAAAVIALAQFPRADGEAVLRRVAENGPAPARRAASRALAEPEGD